MIDTTPHPMPLDGSVIPRFAGPCTFMRLPTFDDAQALDIPIIGVPFDGATTNRPGARLAPREIRVQSSLTRLYNPVLDVAPYELARVGDMGDVGVNPVDVLDTIGRIAAFFSQFRARAVRPIAVGGDHLISYPVLKGLAPRQPWGMVHFDAHSDTGDCYYGNARYTHGTPFRRAVEDGLLDPVRIIQIGIRGSLYGADDMEWARSVGIRIVDMEEVRRIGLAAVVALIRDRLAGQPAYLSFDIDCIEPAFAPGTGTPEVGGFTVSEALTLLRSLKGLDLVAADLVEVSPPLDHGTITSLTAANLLFEIVCLLSVAVAQAR